MAYIPENARWYLADLVLEFSVGGDPRNVIHVNVHLIEAISPEQAYEKANARGRDAESTYSNTEGREVRVRFRGLRDLVVIYEDLEDGAELAYEESVALPEAEIAKWLRSKEDLGVFRKSESGFKTGMPNYMPESVMELLKEADVAREEIESGE